MRLCSRRKFFPPSSSLESLLIFVLCYSGSADHTIRVYNTSSNLVSSFEPYMSFLNRTPMATRHAPITATAFHPHRMMLACGAINDGHVNLFKCQTPEVDKRDGAVEEWKK